ncbi:hypothetical protein QUF64_09635 [Anaerolineales bacterium HSG6]|nr:hypothetical protein [Anaerolineales bacterium HSG6]
MKIVVTESTDIRKQGRRLDASYHASDGVQILKHLHQWANANQSQSSEVLKTSELLARRLDTLAEVCQPDGLFIPGRFKRTYVDTPEHGVPYLTGGSILQANPTEGTKFLSRKYTAKLDRLALHEHMILITCSGTIGNTVYVNKLFENTVGSPDLIRVLADSHKIESGYLYAFISSSIGRALIQQKTYGAVVPHIEAHHVADLPIPRLEPVLESRIHQLVEQAAELRVRASEQLETSKKRFQKEVLGLDRDIKWQYRHEHAFTVDVATFSKPLQRLDAFHYVGYVGEAEKFVRDPTHLGELVKAYQPTLFKRPYTGENGIPFLSGVDLYDAYPKPRMYISRKLRNIKTYQVESGTILIQRVGQRYGLFGRPVILSRHLDKVAVSEHLIRLYTENKNERGYIYVWLSTEFGRRLVLKDSFGTSMGVLSEKSIEGAIIPKCSAELRHSFEPEIEQLCTWRDQANRLEDQAQALLKEALGLLQE